MDASQILTALTVGESIDWEFKSAKGGFPGSFWDILLPVQRHLLGLIQPRELSHGLNSKFETGRGITFLIRHT
jgi:hypothetical protein